MVNPNQPVELEPHHHCEAGHTLPPPDLRCVHIPGVDDFEADLDGRVANDPAGSWTLPNQSADGEFNLEEFINLPQHELDAPSCSVYSDALSASTLPASPDSVASDETAVDSDVAASPKVATDDILDCMQLPASPAMAYGYYFGFPAQARPLVMYDSLLITPPVESQHPPEFSFHHPVDHTGQPQQQHLLGAVASFAHGEMSTLADKRVGPLTPQTSADVPAASVEVTSDAPPPTASTSGRKRANRADDEKPTKRRRVQSTEKKLKCPLCDSMWARSHNLRTHIKSVHEQQRSHACPAATCNRAFSRRHDLTRHYQSEHTDLPSPRRKAPKM
ncbi:hypothetical protein C2E23DRAFT_724547 [Lenzites betulinus]|nr:hypothetical protein C2E23DRAFT_724547 [Lenzites betulinus]